MTVATAFVKGTNEYKRDLNIVKGAIEDSALYLSIQAGITLEEATRFVKETIGPNGSMPLVDPATRFLDRDPVKGRSKKLIPFSQYLREIEENNWIMAPTLTVYENPDVRESILSMYINGNVKKRSVEKKAGQAAKQKKDFKLAALKHVLQTTFKIKNNSISGAHSSPHNSLYLKSAHPTLTSTCRSATSYSNANTERFLAGNRHYRNADIAIANILSIINNSDMDKIEAVMQKFNVHYPTAEETFEAVMRSCRQYWRAPDREAEIQALISKLTPLQRAAFLYTQDMYHLAMYNKELVKGILMAISSKGTAKVDDPKSYVKMMDSDLIAHVGIVCAEEVAGTTIWDLESKDPEKYNVVGSTIKSILDGLQEYGELISALWCTDNPPPSMSFFPGSMRKSVIVSDTDSTIFTVQDWIRWYNDGDLVFSRQMDSLAAGVVYLITQTTIHLLAQLSAGMGVPTKELHRIAMKNEFMMPVLSLTSKAKHYYNYISACEGNVYSENEAEYKGVSLKNSKIPKHIMKRFQAFTEGIMDDVIAGKTLSIKTLLETVVVVENEIRDSVLAGHSDYLQLAAVKDKVSYKIPESSPYVHYELWQEVFAPKYGSAPPPPYGGAKISLMLQNYTSLQAWLNNMEDQELSKRMRKWLEERKRRDFQMIYVPLEIVSGKGLPKELEEVADVRKVCSTLLEPFLLVLESVGVYMNNDHNTKLPSDILRNLPAYVLG